MPGASVGGTSGLSEGISTPAVGSSGYTVCIAVVSDCSSPVLVVYSMSGVVLSRMSVGEFPEPNDFLQATDTTVTAASVIIHKNLRLMSNLLNR